MPKFKVTAPDGVKGFVRVQKQEEHVNIIPAVKSSSGEVLSLERTEKFSTWVDVGTDSFASESREYEIAKNERLIVHEG